MHTVLYVVVGWLALVGAWTVLWFLRAWWRVRKDNVNDIDTRGTGAF